MTRILTLSAIVLAIGLTVAGGLLHGTLRNRWGTSANMKLAGKNLQEQFPTSFGDWELVVANELVESVERQLECDGFVNNVYKNSKTGAIVNVAIVFGPSGPIAVHVPEVCYSSRDHKIVQERQVLKIPNEGKEHSFWGLTFQSNKNSAELLRVCYSWTTGDQVWDASENARWDSMFSPFLYKVQIAATVPNSAGFDSKEIEIAEGADPTRGFLRDFVPVFEKFMKSHHPSETIK